MISQLRKKHPTTQPNTRPAIRLDPDRREFRHSEVSRLARLALGGTLVLLLLGVDGFAGTNSSSSSNATLQWGRPAVAGRAAKSPEKIRTAQRRRTRVVRDARVVAAAWQEEDALGVQTVAADRSVVVERSAPAYEPPAYDPFDEDDRLAQLPDDPFDEPVGESIPVPEPETDIDTVEDALEQEIQRRQSADDFIDEEMKEPFGEDPLGDDPLDDFDEIDPLDDDPAELLQRGEDDRQAPDLGLDFGQDDTEEDEDEPTPEELEEQRKELAKEQRESEENCRVELAEIEADRISSIDLSLRVEGDAGEDFPYECAVSTKSHQPRQWPQITYNWKASALCHKPLYFEQVQLERYGHSWGPYVQPIMSGVHFFGSLPVLPYKMGIRTPTECVYTLGYYRPGSCAPYMLEPIPFTWRAALFEGAAVTGISFTIP